MEYTGNTINSKPTLSSLLTCDPTKTTSNSCKGLASDLLPPKISKESSFISPCMQLTQAMSFSEVPSDLRSWEKNNYKIKTISQTRSLAGFCSLHGTKAFGRNVYKSSLNSNCPEYSLTMECALLLNSLVSSHLGYLQEEENKVICISEWSGQNALLSCAIF